VPTASVIPATGGELPSIEGHPALLFERIPGAVQQKPEYPLDLIGPALARIHQVQIDQPLGIEGSFTFDDACMIWLPQFSRYLASPGHDPAIADALKTLVPVVERFNPGPNRAALYARSPSVHCHGDVTPKNVIVADGTARFFDFNNAFYGPRMADVIDGAFEVSLAEKYIELADFGRFDAFIDAYSRGSALTAEEREDIPRWLELIGVIKFTKEVRVMLERPTEALRRRRALAVADYVRSRLAV
jgi:Ser/Thr protein kinase RdoA (MazF antagonist)